MKEGGKEKGEGRVRGEEVGEIEKEKREGVR